jgi:plastocyanin
LLLTTSLLLAVSPEVAAQGIAQYGGVGQEGARVPAPWVPEVSLGSRFLPLQLPTGIPSLGLRVGAWSGGALGLSYSGSGSTPGNPHELEFSAKQRLFSEERGAPLTASVLGAVNTGSYSIDGELALSRDLGPLTLMGTARLLGNADGARLPLGGFGAGARLGILPQVALVGDVFQVVNDAGVLPAWGAGVQLQLPASPYALTLHLANTPSSTRQGASLGTSDLRFGIDMEMVFPGWSQGRAPAPALARVAESDADVKPAQKPASIAETPVRAAQAPESVPPKPRDPESGSALPGGPASKAASPVVPQRSEAAQDSQPVVPAKAKVKATVKPVSKPAAIPTAKPTPKPRPASKVKESAKAIAKPKVRTHSAPAPKRSHESELWIVMIRDGRPTPVQVRLSRGSSVTWFNRDATAHALVASGWDSGSLAAGAQVTRRFEKAGTFQYHCRLHPNEGGTITVY